MHVFKSLTLYAGLWDSPHFRQSLHDHEESLQLTAREMRDFEAQCRHVLTLARKLSDAYLPVSIAQSAYSARTSEGDCMRNAANGRTQVDQAIGQRKQKCKESIDQAERRFFKPLGDLRERIKYVLSTEKSRFERASERFYAEQARNLAKSTMKVASFEEFDRSLTMETRKFHIAAQRYACQLQCIGKRIKFDFVESAGAFLDALFSSFHEDNALRGKIKPFLDKLKADIRFVEARLSLRESSSTRLEMAYLSGMNKTVLNRRPKNDMIKEAYVYVPTKRMGLKLLPTAWRRHYAVYSKETRVLTLVPVNTESLQGMREVLKLSRSFKVISAQSTTAANRRFCIDVTSANGTTTVIQAVTQEDYRDLLDCINP
ncbi:Protein T04C9.1 b [Aphelenchoides avenae]|nr:Protein T04C9.1 b [Aphelenchus avenae]